MDASRPQPLSGAGAGSTASATLRPSRSEGFSPLSIPTRLHTTSDADRIAAAVRLRERHIEIVNTCRYEAPALRRPATRIAAEAPEDLAIPTRPVVGHQWFGYTSLNTGNIVTDLLVGAGVRGAAQECARRPHEKLTAATKALSHLFVNIDPEESGDFNRNRLIKAVKDSITSLQAIVSYRNPKRILRIPQPANAGDIPDHLRIEILNRIMKQIELLSHYLGYLEGHRQIDDVEHEMPCTRQELEELRTVIFQTLFTEEEYQAVKDQSPRPAAPKGLLSILLHFKDAQEGVVPGLVASLVDTLKDYGTAAVQDILGTQDSVCREIDTPKLEILGHTRIETQHIKEESTIMGLVKGCVDFFKTGSADSMIRTSCVGLLAILRHVHLYLSGAGRSLLSEEAAKSGESEHSILTSLASCIELLQAAKERNKRAADIKAAFNEVKSILSRHSIWLGSVVNFGLPQGIAHEPITQTLSVLQKMDERPQPSSTSTPNYERDASQLANEVTEIGSYRAAYEALFTYFIKPERGSWLTPDDLPSFHKIVAKLDMTAGNETERRKIVLQEFRVYIRKATDINFIKRWLLVVFAGKILWLCEHTIKSFKTGVFEGIEKYIKNAKSVKSSDVSVEPIERLTKAANSLSDAHRALQTGAPLNWDDAVKDLNKDPVFLETRDTGCKTLSATYLKAGDVAVSRYMGSFKPTAPLSRVNNSIFKWASQPKNQILATLLRALTFPITTIISFINNVLILPIEWITNKITHSLIKIILRKGAVVEAGHRLLGDAMFPKDKTGKHSTKVMNQILINLLRKLSDLLDKPTESEESEKFQISKASQTALSDAISSILKFLAVKQTRTPDALKRFDQERESSGLSPVVSQFLRLLIGEDGKDLDSKVAEAIKELLARAYYLLMDEEILNQQLVLALTSMRSGMLSDEEAYDENALAAEIASDEAVIRELRALVLQKSAHLAHTPISKGASCDKAIQAHIAKIHKEFLGDSTTQGLISKWQKLLENPPSLQLFDTILFKELRETWYTLQDDILKLKAEVRSGQVGAASLEIYERNIAPLMTALDDYTTLFLNTYNSLAITDLKGKEEILKQLSEALSTLTSLPTFGTATALSKAHDVLKTKLARLMTTFKTAACPTEVRKFISGVEALAYDRSLIESFDSAEALSQYYTRVQKDLPNIIAEGINSRRVIALQQELNNLHPLLLNIPDSQEIYKIERAIVDIIQNAPNKIDATNQCALQHRKLVDAIQKKYGIVQRRHAAISTSLQGKIAEQTISQQAAIAALSANPPEVIQTESRRPQARGASLHAELAMREALTKVENAAREVRDPSSISIPLDNIPFFKTAESAVVAILDKRFSEIEDEFLKTRNPFMALIIKLGVLAFLNPKNATTTTL